MATLGLGALALWSAVAGPHGARGLTRVGVQTSGHLLAIESMSTIDTQTDALEEGFDPAGITVLANAQRGLDRALVRMEEGGVVEASRIAREARPMVEELKPAIARFGAVLVDDGSPKRRTAVSEPMDEIIGALQLRLKMPRPIRRACSRRSWRP